MMIGFKIKKAAYKRQPLVIKNYLANNSANFSAVKPRYSATLFAGPDVPKRSIQKQSSFLAN